MLGYISNFATNHGGNWSLERLWSNVDRSEVVCRPLVDELTRHTELASLRPSVMLIDVEGLDCRVVAANDWCVEPLHGLSLLIFEHKHCTDVVGAGSEPSTLLSSLVCSDVIISPPNLLDAYTQGLRAARRSRGRCAWYSPNRTFLSAENVFQLGGVGVGDGRGSGGGSGARVQRTRSVAER